MKGEAQWKVAGETSGIKDASGFFSSSLPWKKQMHTREEPDKKLREVPRAR